MTTWRGWGGAVPTCNQRGAHSLTWNSEGGQRPRSLTQQSQVPPSDQDSTSAKAKLSSYWN